MVKPACLNIPLGATIVIPEPLSSEVRAAEDAREILQLAAERSRARVVSQGTIGTRYDVMFRSDSNRVLWWLSGGRELEEAFPV